LIAELEYAHLGMTRMSVVRNPNVENPIPKSNQGDIDNEITVTDSAPTDAPSPAGADTWYVRYRGSDGQWCKTRAQAEEIRRRLRDGQLPAAAEVSRELHGTFCIWKQVTEFQNNPSPTAPAAAAVPYIHPRVLQSRAAPSSWHTNLAWGLALLLLAVGSGLIFYLLSH
jgi:hypothetical protein